MINLFISDYRTIYDIDDSILLNVDYITLTYIYPKKDGRLDLTSLLRHQKEASIVNWIKYVRDKNVKVFVSVRENEPNRWESVRLTRFVRNLLNLGNSWGIDGIDVNQMPICPQWLVIPKWFVIYMVRFMKLLIDNNYNFLINLSCYFTVDGYDSIIISKFKDNINYINLLKKMTDLEMYRALHNEFRLYIPKILNYIDRNTYRSYLKSVKYDKFIDKLYLEKYTITFDAFR